MKETQTSLKLVELNAERQVDNCLTRRVERDKLFARGWVLANDQDETQALFHP